jgi:hypothetical protein
MSAVLLAGLLSSSAVAQAEENSPPAPQASGQASGKRTYKPVKMLDAPKASSDVSESKPSDEAKPDPKVKPKANTLPFKPAKKNGSL